jgi:hypothetical protein
MSARGHVPLRGIACHDVDHVVEEVRLAVLAAEVLRLISRISRGWQRGKKTALGTGGENGGLNEGVF